MKVKLLPLKTCKKIGKALGRKREPLFSIPEHYFGEWWDVLRVGNRVVVLQPNETQRLFSNSGYLIPIPFIERMKEVDSL